MSMVGFVLFLLVVFVLGFIVLPIAERSKTHGHTIAMPIPDEVTTQFAGNDVAQSVARQVERQALPKGTHPNSHWFEHTFCRNGNRKKKG